MPEVAAYAVDSPTGRYEKTTITRREPGPTEVYFDIHYAGICHSDIHTARGEWGRVTYPLVPGHELAGLVSKVGSEGTPVRAGDRVGVGCVVDSCRECDMCEQGEEQFCTGTPSTIWTYNGIGRDGLPTAGGYSQGITVEQDYLMHVPDGMPLEQAAPLMCAGITTYNPLKRWGAGPGKRVGVVGLGGLGHMGVQFAAALGAETIVLSRTLAKRDDGLRFGATDYVSTEDKARMRELRGSFDLILSTVSDGVDLDGILRLLKAHGVLVNVGLPAHPTTFSIGGLTGQARVLAGSNIGGIAETQQMLDFCAEHKLAPMIEIIPASQINEAHENVVAAKVRYRYVIDAATIAE